jgi:hypothetical protein
MIGQNWPADGPIRVLRKWRFPSDTGDQKRGDQPMSITTLKPSHANGSFWSARREASLNWLALGLLLAAWNASDNEAANARPRPEALRGYSYISVRAAHRVASVER